MKKVFCKSAVSIVVLVTSAFVTVTASTLNVHIKSITSCIPGNDGELSADVDGETNGYTFMWYVGLTVKPVPDYLGQKITGLTLGHYTVMAVDDNDVVIGPVTVALQQPVAEPLLESVTAFYDPDVCSDSLYVASVDGGYTNSYQFQWYKGNNVLTAPIFSESSYVYDLKPDIYTVVAFDQTTHCIINIQSFKVDSITFETFQLKSESKSDLTSCLAPNGEIAVSVNGVKEGPFVFSWHEGATTAGLGVSLAFNASQLPAGVYAVEVNEPGCNYHDELLQTVSDARTFPDVTISQSGQEVSVPYDKQFIYNWTRDHELFASTNSVFADESGLYQVEVTTAQGCVATSEEINFVINGIQENHSRISFYPNPVKDVLSIESTVPAITFEIVDLAGRKIVNKQTVDQQIKLDTSQIPSGLYLITFQSGNGIVRRKFVKE